MIAPQVGELESYESSRHDLKLDMQPETTAMATEVRRNFLNIAGLVETITDGHCTDRTARNAISKLNSLIDGPVQYIKSVQQRPDKTWDTMDTIELTERLKSEFNLTHQISHLLPFIRGKRVTLSLLHAGCAISVCGHIVQR